MLAALVVLVPVLLFVGTAPATPTTDILDDFNRPDENPVSQGGNWSPTAIAGNGSALRLVGQRLVPSNSNTAYREAEFTNDVEAYFTSAVTPAPANDQRLYIGLKDAGTGTFDGYSVAFERWSSGFRLSLARHTDGVATAIGLTNFFQAGAGDRVLLRRIGSTIEAWYDRAGTWSRKLSVPNQTLHAGLGKIGVGFGGGGAPGAIDNFGGGNPPPPPWSPPPPGQTRGVGANGRGKHAWCGCLPFGDPVNSRTGAFMTSVDDLALPGTGVSFGWSRSYTSDDPTVGRLGLGWTDSYSASLAVEPNGDVRLHGEDGQQIYYTKQGDGSFVGAGGSLSTLSSVAGGYELVRSDQVKYGFDTQGRLLSIKDRNAQGVTLTYDGQGRLTTVTDAANRQATVSYNAENLVSEVETQDGRSVGYGYTDGRLTSVADVRGETWTYTYDGGGLLEKMIDPLNHAQVTNVYGADARVQSQEDALDKTTTFGWNAETETATATDPNQKVWTHDYLQGALVKELDPLTNQTELTRDADLNTTSVTGPTNEKTTMTYDAAGNMLTAKAPPSLGGVQKTFVYNARNDPSQVTDARGKVTSYTYDADGNTETVTQDGTEVGSYTYDPAGRVLTFTDGNDKTTTYEYFPNGNLSAVIDPLGNKTTYTYDGAGRVLTRVDPKGNVQGADPANFTWSYTYNEAGQVLTETDPLGNMTSYTYDAGNELTVTDANSKTTTYAYDAANRLTSVTAPDGGVTSYTYDNVGNRLTEKDPRDHVTTHTYDAANRLASTTTASGAKTTFFYDANGNLVKQVEPRGNVQGANPDDFDTLFTYDAAGRLLTETDPLGNVTTHTYDAVGNELTVKDVRGQTTSYTYDGKNRLASVTAPAGGGVTSYTYDAAGNKLTETDPRGKTSTYVYDAANGLVSVTTPSGGKTTYGYDPNGNRVTMVEPRGNAQGANPVDFTWTYTYDRANRRVTETDPLGNLTTTAYDNVGNETSAEDANEHVTSYTYDAVNRLKTVTAPDLGVTEYTYDVAGNMTARKDANEHTTTYAYDADNRRTSVTSPIGQVWTTAYDVAANVLSVVDANGNSTPTVGDGKTSYSYDRGGRLTAIDYSDDTPDVAFAYDAGGNRTLMLDGGSIGSSLAGHVVDDFNRSDEDPISQGGAWSATGTSGPVRIRVAGGRAAGQPGSIPSRSHRPGVLKDMAASATIAVKPGNGNHLGITLCTRDVGGGAWDGYRVIWTEVSGTGNDSLRVERITNNAVVATLASQVREYAVGHKLGVRRIGNTIEVWIDDGSGWSKVLEPPDPTYPDGMVGLDMRGTFGRLDDFTLSVPGETYVYDDVNRLSSIGRSGDVFSYLYDLGGNVTRRTYPDATVVNYAFDDDSRMQSVTSAGESTTYGYDAAGNLTQTTPTTRWGTASRSSDPLARRATPITRPTSSRRLERPRTRTTTTATRSLRVAAPSPTTLPTA